MSDANNCTTTTTLTIDPRTRITVADPFRGPTPSAFRILTLTHYFNLVGHVSDII